MKKLAILFQIISLSCFLMAIILFSQTPLVPDPQYQWNMLILTAIGTVSFFVIQKEQYKKFQWLSISTIFVLGYLIVFYQMILLNLIGYEVPHYLFKLLWASENVINESIGLSTLGLLAFYLGATNIISTKSIKFFNKGNKKTSNNSIFLLLMFAYVFYILFVSTAGSYIYGEYTPTDASGASSYFYKLFKISLSAAIIVKVSYITFLENKQLSFKEYLSYFGKPLLILLFWFIAFSLFVGDRGPIIYFALLAFGIYFLRWKKISLLRAIVFLFILSTLLTIVGEIRQSRFSGVGYIDRMVNVFSGYGSNDNVIKGFDANVPGSGTIELAFSVHTLNHAIYNVPDNYSYAYGAFQLQYIVSIVPGLSGIISPLLFGDATEYYGSSKFITYLVQGKNPTHGNGSSVVADFYLDFGVYGVIIGMFLFGYFVRKNEYKLFFGYQKLTLVWIATLIFFSQALYLSRSSIGLVFSNIVLVYILIKMNTYFVAHFKIKN